MNDECTCIYCGSTFPNTKSLQNHQDKIQSCKKYRGITFTCDNCGKTTKNIKEIENHYQVCIPSSVITPTENISNSKLEMLLTIERAKSAVWRQLLEDNTSIKISDVMVEDENIIKISTPGNLTILIEESTKNCNCNITIKTEDEPTVQQQKKQTYRSLKNEVNEDIEPVTINTPIEPVVKDDINYLDVINEFDGLFEKLLQSKTYNKILNEIRLKRNSIIKCMHVDKYIELLKDHIEKMEKIFQDKKYTPKKVQSMVSKGLYPLDIRLTRYGSYTDSNIDADEIEKFFIVLQLGIGPISEVKPYCNNTICGYFYNYGLALFSFEKLVEIFLFNPGSFHNIIYLPLSKSLDEDPYSFYVLDKVNKEKKYWNMDCRLDDVSNGLITNILPYMISMFRGIYKHIFGDNNFRSDYSNMCQITEYECEQLLQNIILLSDTKKFTKFLQNNVRKFATYIPTDVDKFNLKGDDPLQRKQFHEKDSDSIDVFKQLFDNISTEESVDFYRSRIT